jgi:hypothetical protein
MMHKRLKAPKENIIPNLDHSIGIIEKNLLFNE